MHAGPLRAREGGWNSRYGQNRIMALKLVSVIFVSFYTKISDLGDVMLASTCRRPVEAPRARIASPGSRGQGYRWPRDEGAGRVDATSLLQPAAVPGFAEERKRGL